MAKIFGQEQTQQVRVAILICTIRLADANLSKFHSIYHHIKKIHEQYMFILCLPYGLINKVISFVIHFLPKIICMDKKQAISQRQLDCEYQWRNFIRSYVSILYIHQSLTVMILEPLTLSLGTFMHLRM